MDLDFDLSEFNTFDIAFYILVGRMENYTNKEILITKDWMDEDGYVKKSSKVLRINKRK